MKTLRIIRRNVAAVLCAALCLWAGAGRVAAATPLPRKTEQTGLLDYAETLALYADRCGVTAEETVRMIGPAARFVQEPCTRVLSVRVDIAPDCRPWLDFYCDVDTDGHYWAIRSIYAVQLRGADGGRADPFGGTIAVFLRSPYEIEYILNGDFFKTGTATQADSALLRIGPGGPGTVNFTVSNTSAANHKTYGYGNDRVAFQA